MLFKSDFNCQTQDCSPDVNCLKCGLYKNKRHPKQSYTGEGKLNCLIVAESPGCISGDSFIEVAFRDKSKYPNGIPIKELVGTSGFYVYSFDVKTNKIVLGRVKRVWKTGRKLTYRVKYNWWFNKKESNILKSNELRVTSNHPFLLKPILHNDPFKGLNTNTKPEYVSINSGLSVGHSLLPFYRYPLKYAHIKSLEKKAFRESRFLLEKKIRRKLTKKEQVHLKLNNLWVLNKFKNKFPNVELPSPGNHKVVSIEKHLFEDVYDMEVEIYHNFATNGIFIHNSDEDAIGKQLVGDVGKWFRRKLAGFDLSLDRDFWKMNSVSCRPTDGRGNNRKPTPQEIQYCKARVISTINELKPKFIWLMGNTAIESFYSEHFDTKLATIGKWRRRCIPDPTYNAYIIPLWHPSYVSRNEKDLNMQSVYINDLQVALEQLENKPITPLELKIFTTTNFEQAMEWLTAIRTMQPELLYFDYETNCLKPQLTGSKVATISCACNGEAFSFPYEYPNSFTKTEKTYIREAWCELLSNPAIGKAAHNCQFENNWSCVHFTEPKNWVWDTQLAAHILDNRRGIYGLKFQSYVKLGILPYDKEIEPYLKADGKNQFNDIDKAPLDKLLTYNAMDSFCGLNLRKIQVKEFLADRKKSGRLYEANQFFLEGAVALADMERTGLRTDQPYFKQIKRKIEADNEELKKKILVDPYAVKFRKSTGRPLSIKSNVGADDLRYLLENVLRVPIEKVTATELTSTDSEVLTRLTNKYPIIKNIVDLRSGVQLLKTYVMGYIDWAIDGYVYPNIGLQRPTSFRSSAQNPNIQNVPRRLEHIKKLIRQGIKPRPGRQLGETDFSGIEVAVGCCYHKDPVMIKYLVEGGDMHRDAAVDIWLLPPEEIEKKIRFFSKNQWVFPQFYGSVFVNCARGLWENCIDLPTTSGEPLREHMRVKGIKTLDEFTEHTKDCEQTLWRRFRVYKRWKDNQETIFQKQGFIETYFGFKFTDYMKYNELSNLPIQGTAFHILLWTYIRVNQKRREEEWRTKIPAEVHDSMMFDFAPKEVNHILKAVKHIAEVETRKHFEWINIPIKIEAELAPVGASWYDIKPYEV